MDENNSDNMVIINLIPEPSFRPTIIDSNPQTSNNIYGRQTHTRLSEILKKKDEKFIADANMNMNMNMNMNEPAYFEPPEYWKELELSDFIKNPFILHRQEITSTDISDFIHSLRGELIYDDKYECSEDEAE